MDNFKYTIPAKVIFKYIPPRCRKAREGEREEVLEFSIPTVSEDHFPLVYTVYNSKHLTESDEDVVTATPYRAFVREDNTFDFYKPATHYDKLIQVDETAEEGIKSLVDYTKSQVLSFRGTIEEHEIQEKISTFQSHFIVYGSILWTITEEPHYRYERDFENPYMTVEIGDAAPGDPRYDECYRADEKTLIVADIEQHYDEDTANYWKERLNQEHIQIEDTFLTKMAPRETRLIDHCRMDVMHQLSSMLGSSQKTLEGFDAINKLCDRLIYYIWNESEYKDNEYILYNDIFQKAFIQTLSEAYGVIADQNALQEL